MSTSTRNNWYKESVNNTKESYVATLQIIAMTGRIDVLVANVGKHIKLSNLNIIAFDDSTDVNLGFFLSENS